jgi:integrase
VFPGQRNPIASANGFIIAIHKACDAAGVAHIRWHDLRHYYASVLLDRLGNNWWQIQNLMGHADITTTQSKYGHWLDDEARDDEISNAVAGGFKSYS